MAQGSVATIGDRAKDTAVIDKGEVYSLIPGLVIVTDLDRTIPDLNEPAARAAERVDRSQGLGLI